MKTLKDLKPRQKEHSTTVSTEDEICAYQIGYEDAKEDVKTLLKERIAKFDACQYLDTSGKHVDFDYCCGTQYHKKQCSGRYKDCWKYEGHFKKYLIHPNNNAKIKELQQILGDGE